MGFERVLFLSILSQDEDSHTIWGGAVCCMRSGGMVSGYTHAHPLTIVHTRTLTHHEGGRVALDELRRHRDRQSAQKGKSIQIDGRRINKKERRADSECTEP